MLNTTAFLLPLFLGIAFIECMIAYRKSDKKLSAGAITMNITLGAIDQISSLFYFVVLYYILNFTYTHYRIFEIKNEWYQWLLAYILIDFISYWYHRISHRVNFFWAGHITHHSSEYYNYTNGFRTSPFQGINRIPFWAVMPIFGFSPVVLLILLKVSGIWDFIVHTENVTKLGFLEKFMITPSMHRVHHGKNDIYIDKNYGSNFKIWDKMFGTYQEETEPVTYGIKADYKDNNPYNAIGFHYQYLWNTMKATPNWFEKLKLLVMPPEWKPKNLQFSTSTHVRKLAEITTQLKQYAYFQLTCGIVGVISLLLYKDFLSVWEFLLCAILGVMTLANDTMILNENIREGFEKREILRLTLGTILVLITMYMYSNWYLFPIIIFLAISIIIISNRKAEDFRRSASY